jgi:hypothetical protein
MMNLRRHFLLKAKIDAVLVFSAEKIFVTPHLRFSDLVEEKRCEHCQILAE